MPARGNDCELGDDTNRPGGNKLFCICMKCVQKHVQTGKNIFRPKKTCSDRK